MARGPYVQVNRETRPLECFVRASQKHCSVVITVGDLRTTNLPEGEEVGLSPFAESLIDSLGAESAESEVRCSETPPQIECRGLT